MKLLNKKKEPEFKGPKRTEIFGVHYELDQILIHKKTKNEFQIKEIQAAGFIVWLVRSLGNKVDSKQRMYISYGNINEYR